MANISITAVCQKCGSKSEINYYQNINVQDSPELKSQVKDGSLFLWTCSKCGSVNLIPFPVLYHDPDEKTDDMVHARKHVRRRESPD